MTTVMLIAAMIPIALGQGPGAGARASMAKIIIGGQAFSLVLSLVATPVMYSLLDDAKIFFGRRFGWVRKALIPEGDEPPVDKTSELAGIAQSPSTFPSDATPQRNAMGV